MVERLTAHDGLARKGRGRASLFGPARCASSSAPRPFRSPPLRRLVLRSPFPLVDTAPPLLRAPFPARLPAIFSHALFRKPHLLASSPPVSHISWLLCLRSTAPILSFSSAICNDQLLVIHPTFLSEGMTLVREKNDAGAADESARGRYGRAGGAKATRLGEGPEKGRRAPERERKAARCGGRDQAAKGKR